MRCANQAGKGINPFLSIGFGSACRGASLPPWLQIGVAMRLNLAQWTGLCVTTIVITGSDMDVLYAVPVGVIAGAFATLLSALTHSALEKVTMRRRVSR